MTPLVRTIQFLTSAALQYKPSRWWFEFALLYNKIFFVLLSVLLNSDERAWVLLGSLVAITVATLALVAVDKPFRGKDDQDEDATLGDKLMLVALASQLVNYGVAAACLQHKQERIEAGHDEMSDEVALNAAVTGLALVGVQVAGVVYTYLDEKADDTEDTNAGHKGDTLDKESKPKLESQPEPEPEPGRETREEVYRNPVGASQQLSCSVWADGCPSARRAPPALVKA